MLIRKKRCLFCVKKDQVINYTNQNLRNFVSDKGKIVPSRYSGLCAAHQRKVKRAIKLARNIGLMSFTGR